MKNLKRASVFPDVESFVKHLNELRKVSSIGAIGYHGKGANKNLSKIVMTSGGFDPLHVGHLECIEESAIIADDGILVVIVNGDSFLKNKKGYAFMDLETRMRIISSITGVDYVVGFEDPEDMTVCEPIRQVRPAFFTKGGDRNSKKNVPEFATCEEVGTKIIFNVGGGKIQSSSELVGNAMEQINAAE